MLSALYMKYSSCLFFLLAVVAITFAACADEDTDYRESPTAAIDISSPSSARINEPISIGMTVFGSSGCSEFSRFTTTVVGDTTFFQLFQRRDQAAVCTTQIIEIETSIEVSFDVAGTKFMKFNEPSTIFSDEESVIIKEITITP